MSSSCALRRHHCVYKVDVMEDEPEIQVFSKRSKKFKGARSDAPAAGKESTQKAFQISKAELAQATDAAAQQVSPPSAANTGCIQFILWSKEQLGSFKVSASTIY